MGFLDHGLANRLGFGQSRRGLGHGQAGGAGQGGQAVPGAVQAQQGICVVLQSLGQIVFSADFIQAQATARFDFFMGHVQLFLGAANLRRVHVHQGAAHLDEVVGLAGGQKHLPSGVFDAEAGAFLRLGGQAHIGPGLQIQQIHGQGQLARQIIWVSHGEGRARHVHFVGVVGPGVLHLGGGLGKDARPGR